MGPFIHKLKKKKKKYIYDVNSNLLVKVDDIIWDIIDYYGLLSKDEILNKFINIYHVNKINTRYKTLDTLNKKYNFASSFRPKSIRHHVKKNEFIESYKNSMTMLSLCVTERCNLRCKYCIYSTHYPKSQKIKRKDMEFETAKKAIDFYYNHSSSSGKSDPKFNDTHHIAFYGGEPLLNFLLIKNAVSYAKKKFENNKIRFNMTTNLFFLTDEMINFFDSNNITLLVSVDGYKQMHDRNRVDFNGKGTFDAVMTNLQRIKSYSNKYYRRNVMFNMVISPPCDYDKIDQLFIKSDLVSEALTCRFSQVHSYDTTFYNEFTTAELHTMSNKNDIINKYISLFKKKELIDVNNHKSRFALLFVGSELGSTCDHLFKNESPNILNSEILSSRICNPGVNRLFVSTDGSFYPCERVLEDPKTMCIGDVNDGFNIDKCYNIIQSYYRHISED